MKLSLGSSPRLLKESLQRALSRKVSLVRRSNWSLERLSILTKIAAQCPEIGAVRAIEVWLQGGKEGATDPACSRRFDLVVLYSDFHVPLARVREIESRFDRLVGQKAGYAAQFLLTRRLRPQLFRLYPQISLFQRLYQDIYDKGAPFFIAADRPGRRSRI